MTNMLHSDLSTGGVVIAVHHLHGDGANTVREQRVGTFTGEQELYAIECTVVVRSVRETSPEV